MKFCILTAIVGLLAIAPAYSAPAMGQPKPTPGAKPGTPPKTTPQPKPSPAPRTTTPANPTLRSHMPIVSQQPARVVPKQPGVVFQPSIGNRPTMNMPGPPAFPYGYQPGMVIPVQPVVVYWFQPGIYIPR